MAKKVKIFGERNTSTNAIKQLIHLNYCAEICPATAKDIDPMALRNIANIRHTAMHGVSEKIEDYIDSVFAQVRTNESWKHCATLNMDLSDFSDTFVIFMLRHPASWLLSFHNNPYHALQEVPVKFYDFIISDWRTVMREKLAGACCTPIELYNKKIETYFGFADQLAQSNIAYMFIRFEDFACDQMKIINDLDGVLDRKRNDPELVFRSTKDNQKNADYYRDYYGKHRWCSKIQHDEWELIKWNTKWELFFAFGYLENTTAPVMTMPNA